MTELLEFDDKIGVGEILEISSANHFLYFEKKEFDNNTLIKHTKFVYDGNNVVAEYEDNTLSKKYLWGEDVSGSMAGAGGVGALLVVNDTTEDYYSMYDGNGNIVKYVDETSNLVASFEYTPFGALKSESGSMVDELHYRFSTKYFDNNTNLIVYRYRNYNPQTGKWQTRDPLGELTKEGNFNLLYGFIQNNPISKLDKLGLYWSIKREGKNWAEAKRTDLKKDPISHLALLVRLNYREREKWLKNIDYSDVSENDLKTKCKFKVPNTVSVYTSKPKGGFNGYLTDSTLSGFGAVTSNALKRGKAAETLGFNVVYYKSYDSAYIFKHMWKISGIWGVIFAGHGTKNFGFSPGPSKFYIAPPKVDPPYKLAYIAALACYTADGYEYSAKVKYVYWTDLLSENGYFIGGKGEIYNIGGPTNLHKEDRRGDLYL
ncbi:RHS repeat-associated core domain-containing protein [Lentisphaerota bacterium WC36G]|nr:RHS repeat-associated core domain-containing protein [Lentisphaerae bacterium WC36]